MIHFPNPKLTSLTATEPLSIVPVMTVPWPRIGKQWSTENTNAPDEDRSGTNTLEDRTYAEQSL